MGENWKPKSLKRTQDVSSTAKSLKYFQVDDYGKIKIPEYENLPILDHKDEILSKLENTQVLIITGETGSGKSTQVPQYILGIGSFTSDPSYKLEFFQLIGVQSQMRRYKLLLNFFRLLGSPPHV